MPIYEYRCDQCGATFEVMQKMSDDPLVTCEDCGGRLHKVLHPVAVHFKGSGFYTTDYGKGSGRRTGPSDEGAGAAATSPSSTPGDAASPSASPPSGDAAAASSGGRTAKDGRKAKEKQKTA